MQKNDLIKEGTDASFAADVIEASKSVPVLVDFWAPWCGPCRTLGPMIERVVTNFGGAVKLVKINVDENPHFSGQLKVQSIPAVFAFKDGQPIDGFMGALPESQIKAFIEKLVGAAKGGSDIDKMFASAEESLALDDIGGAAQSFAQILQVDGANIKALVGMARCYLKGDDLEGAEGLLAQIPIDKSFDANVLSLKAQIALVKEVSGATTPAEILEKLRQNPDDLDNRFELARAYISHGDFEGAIEALFVILSKDLDWNEKKARLQLIKIFDVLGSDSVITRAGRKRLSSLLFS